MAVTDLLSTPVIGYRGWLVGDNDRLFPLLHFVAPPGPYRDRCWEEKPTRAYCRRVQTFGMCAEALNCRCGLYAATEPHRPLACVTGAIVAWGRIVQHERGFRAEYARPIAFVESAGVTIIPYRLHPERLATLAERFGVPVLPLDEIAAYARWFGEPLETTLDPPSRQPG